MARILGWLAAAVVVTLIFGSVYGAFQQPGRRPANDAPAAAAGRISVGELQGQKNTLRINQGR